MSSNTAWCTLMLGVFAVVQCGCSTALNRSETLHARMSEMHASWGSAPDIEAYLRAGTDPRVDPCEDFYAYACSRVPKGNYRPANVGIVEARRRAIERAEAILVEEGGGPEDAMLAEARALYEDCRDKRIHSTDAWVEAIQTRLAGIASATDTSSVLRETAQVQLLLAGPFFHPMVSPEPDEPSRNVLRLMPADFLLGAAEFYQEPGSPYSGMRAWYVRRMRHLLTVLDLGATSPDRVLQFETDLAAALVAVPFDERRADLSDGMTPAEFTARFGPHFAAYFEALPVPVERVVFGPRAYFERLAQLLLQTDIGVLKGYLAMHHAAVLGGSWRLGPDACADWVTVAFPNTMERLLGPPLGPAEQERVDVLVEGIRQAMSEETQVAGGAPEVLAKVQEAVVIRRPDQLETVEDFTGRVPGDFVGSVEALRRRLALEGLRNLARPVDRQRARLHAFLQFPIYRPDLNAVFIGPRMLEPPIFAAAMPAPVLYGALGAILGHELGHAVSPGLREYDAMGRLDRSFAEAQRQQSPRMEACNEEVYQSFERAPEEYVALTASMQPALPLDLERTRDENFADEFGIRAAHRAWLATHGAQGPSAQEHQSFFLSYAQLWCGPEENTLLQRFGGVFDEHAPSKARVNATLSLSPAFAEAFTCKPGAAMRRHDTCRATPASPATSAESAVANQ